MENWKLSVSREGSSRTLLGTPTPVVEGNNSAKFSFTIPESDSSIPPRLSAQLFGGSSSSLYGMKMQSREDMSPIVIGQTPKNSIPTFGNVLPSISDIFASGGLSRQGSGRSLLGNGPFHNAITPLARTGTGATPNQFGSQAQNVETFEQQQAAIQIKAEMKNQEAFLMPSDDSDDSQNEESQKKDESQISPKNNQKNLEVQQSQEISEKDEFTYDDKVNNNKGITIDNHQNSQINTKQLKQIPQITRLKHCHKKQFSFGGEQESQHDSDAQMADESPFFRGEQISAIQQQQGDDEENDENQESIEQKMIFRVIRVDRKTNQEQILNRHRKIITKCNHTLSEYYSKGMCKKCYYKVGKKVRASECKHTDRMHYAKGLCHSCYVLKFKKKKLFEQGITDKKKRGRKPKSEQQN